LISSSKHAINAKNQPLVSVSGHFRLIAAVNNQDKLRFGQVHGKEDVEAIQKRILSIDVREQAAPLFDYKNFVENDWIAEHILWLHKTRKVSDARFGVEYESTETLSLIRSKETEHVLECVLWNLEARRYEADNTGEDSPALSIKGRVLLNTEL